MFVQSALLAVLITGHAPGAGSMRLLPPEGQQMLPPKGQPLLGDGCGPAYRCPVLHLSAEDAARLRECRAKLPVLAPSSTSRSDWGARPLYLFLLSPPRSGSSALLSMIATSPRVATLCPANTWQCEGTGVLTSRHLMDKDRRWEPNSTNWTQALDAYEEVWREDIKMRGPQAYIRVDKSPANIAKIQQIAEHFAADKEQVAFIIMTSSPCRKSRDSVHHWQKCAQMQYDGRSVLADGYRFVEIHYEDFVTSPCATASRILEVLPELELLNPDIHGHRSSNASRRDTPVLEYALRRAEEGARFTRCNAAVSTEAYELSRRLGFGSLPQTVACPYDLPCTESAKKVAPEGRRRPFEWPDFDEYPL